MISGRTEIITAPISQVVNTSTTVIFHCEAITDLTELKNLEYKWKFNKFDVLELGDTRISQNTREHSLQIMGATVRDTGDYTCVAQNSIDSDEATARLVVQGKCILFFALLPDFKFNLLCRVQVMKVSFIVVQVV